MVSRCARFRRSWVLAFGLATWGVFLSAPFEENAAQAQTAVSVVRVEEDWELVVGNPDPTVDGPQVTCTISPTGNLNGLHTAIELNHRSQPSFTPGGVQLQVWNGESLVAATSYNNSSELATPDERIRWTQTMTLNGSNLVFEVVNGSSTTWGSFGGQGYLKAIVSTTVSDLNGYHPDASVQNSGVGFAGNRVTSLVLKEVRLITSTGEVLRDTTPRVVH